MLKKILKIFLWVVVSIVGLLLLVSVLVFLPPVQNLIRDKAAKAVSQSLGMDLSIGKIRLRFPLALTVDDAVLVSAQGDTLANVGHLKAGIAVAPLFTGKVVAGQLLLEDVAGSYGDSLSGMRLTGSLGQIRFNNTRAHPKKTTVDIGTLGIERADIELFLGEGAASADTAASGTAAAWMLGLRRLDLSDVDFRMHTSPSVTELTVTLSDGSLRDLSVDMGARIVAADLLRLEGGSYSYLSDTMTHIPAATATDSLNAASLPWTVDLGRLELSDNALRYGSLYGTPAPGFDPAHIELSGVGLRIDSIYNRGTDVAAVIRSLTASERSGLRITEGEGRFTMDSTGIRLAAFELHTAASQIKADIDAGAAILEMAPGASLSASVDATVGMTDAFLLYPFDPAVRKALAGKPLILTADVAGTFGNLSVRNLRARLANNIDFRANGNVRSLPDPRHISGKLDLAGTFTGIDFIRDMLPDTALRDRIGFPGKTTLSGDVSVSGGVYSPDLVLAADSGRLAVSGRLDTRLETYRAELTVTDFPVDAFLPYDSLGTLSLSLSAQGRGFDPRADSAATDIDLEITRLDYNGFDFSGIALAATLEDHILSGSLESANEAFRLDMALEGELRDNLYAAALKGAVAKADIEAMGFSPTPLALAFRIDASANADLADTAYKANLSIDSVQVSYGNRVALIGKTTLDAKADRSSVTARLVSGDLTLDFTSRESINTLVDGFGRVTDLAMRQIDSLDIDMLPLQEAMPPFKLDFLAQRNNPLREYLRTRGMDFNRLSVTAGSDGTTPFGATVVANGFRTGGVTLDTLNVWLRRRDEKLGYALRLRNKPGNIEQMAFIGVAGEVGGSAASANFLQHDRSDSIGFRFGVTAELLDSAVRATLTPLDPVFGYRKWTVNEGNYFTYHFDKRMEADLRLEGENEGQFFRLTSGDSLNMPPGSLGLDMAGIRLEEIFSLFPSPMPIKGALAAKGAVGLSDDIIKGNLKFGINGFGYDGENVGSIGLGATARINEDDDWELLLDLSVDDRTALTAHGTYDIGRSDSLDMKIAIPGFQLATANAFLPADMARLEGTLHGELDVKGTLAAPALDGGINFDKGRIAVPMIGTSFGITSDSVRIAGNRVVFRNFGLVAPNSQRLALDGSLDIGDFSAMRANLRLFAANFQAVNSTRGSDAQVYGRAALDVDMTIRGLLDALSIRGNVNILSSTNIYYTMRDSPLEVQDAKQNIVAFVSFADEQDPAITDSVPLRRQSSRDMLVNVDVQDNVRATLNLSQNGNNRIELAGDGALTYTMNSQGDTRLTGRYTLSGGTVVYGLPVIGSNSFGIDDGSFVQWTGKMLDPSFNITATEATPIRVVQDGAARSVNFNVIVNVNNTLENMKLDFDLAAPADATIQNELQGMAPEQRSTQALYVLVTNTYTSQSTSTQQPDFNVNQQLGNFISQELNQWARNNLSGVDLSVGIDNVEDGTGSSHTDYSYSVSKSLFSDRLKVTVGGSVSDNPAVGNMTENLVDDISLEYRLAERDNMFLKVYRYNTQESILEGEVTESGAGFIVRKKMNRLRELFRLTPDPQKRQQRLDMRGLRMQLREEERQADGDPARRQRQDDPLTPLMEAPVMSSEPDKEE